MTSEAVDKLVRTATPILGRQAKLVEELEVAGLANGKLSRLHISPDLQSSLEDLAQHLQVKVEDLPVGEYATVSSLKAGPMYAEISIPDDQQKPSTK